MIPSPPTTLFAILNLTPDSFAGDGHHTDIPALLHHAETALMQGAEVLDIGAESTRPGATPIAESEELARLLPALGALQERFPAAMLSVDTTKAGVARAALARGASLVNDVSGGLADTGMLPLVAESGCPIILTHNTAHRLALRETGVGIAYAAPAATHTTDQETFLAALQQEMRQLAASALKAGVARNNIILDPGLGFGKTVSQNMAILANLPRLKQALGYPLLIGASRKSFIGEITHTRVEGRLPGTLAVHTLAAWLGADMLRVHDVAETMAVLRIIHHAHTATLNVGIVSGAIP